VKVGQVATPVALIALATGVAAYVYFVDRATISDADRAARRRDVFPSFRVDEVTRVELTQPGESLVLERDTDAGAGGVTWTMTAPRRGPADPGAVDALLRELEVGVRVRDVDDSFDAGLGSPRVRGSVTMGALVLRFSLGADAPRPEGAAYMRVEGEGTFVVGRSLRAQLLRTADAYRPRSLTPYGASEIARLQVTEPDGAGFTLERHGAGFRLADSGVRASRATVDHLFTALAEARAETFLDDTAADRALGAGATTLVLSSRESSGARVELRLGGECPGEPADVVAVRTAPAHVSACVARSLVDAFAVKAAALVDPSPLFARADEIEDLRLEDLAGGPRVDLARRGSGWHERAPEERDLSSDESDSANILASALAGARASEVVAPKAAAAERTFVARSRATVIRTGGSSTEIVEVAALGADGTTWARRVDDGALLRLPNAVARRLQPHPVALRAGAVWRTAIDPGEIVALESSCGAGERLEWHGGAWTLKAPAGFAPDPLATSDLTSALARARADAWLAESDDGSFGLSDPGSCTAAMTVGAPGDGGMRRATITFGAATEGGFYARTSDDAAVFEVPGILRSLLTHPVIERRRFLLDPASLTSLLVTRDGVRREASLATEGGTAIADALSGLVVRAALHTGRAGTAEGFDRPVLEVVATTRAEAGLPAEARLTFGAPARIDGVDGYFARAGGLDATFFVLKPGVDALLAAVASELHSPP
jgi:hypothetical protein